MVLERKGSVIPEKKSVTENDGKTEKKPSDRPVSIRFSESRVFYKIRAVVKLFLIIILRI